MGRYHSYINTSLQLLRLYNGEMPFSIFIKQFFAKEKKYGSNDRKQIAAICYSYFRVGLALKKQITEENLLQAFFIVSTAATPLIEQLKPAWYECSKLPAEEKITFLNASYTIDDIFPYVTELHTQTGKHLFSKSFLVQPALFARVRPQYKQTTSEKIKAAGIEHHFLNDDNCVQFLSNTNIDSFLAIDKEIVIQDYNSQQVLNYIKDSDLSTSQKEVTVWDCCAASGGKSILIYDLVNGKINLTVSDIRQSIINNLQQRFKNAGIKKYQHFIGDISKNEKQIPAGNYDIIICDAPCTGSGTWSRTPEQLYFFDSTTIETFANTQKKIAVNASAHLNNNGLLFYITCSVFTKENEEVAAHIGKQKGMQLVEMKNLPGYEIQADSMFVAVFRKLSH